MALLKDASSPTPTALLTNAANTSASFTPPSGSLIVAQCVTGNSASGVQSGAISDSLGGTWVTDQTANTSGSGMVAIVRRTTATSGSAMTVTWTPSGATGQGSSLSVDVYTGAAASPLGHVASATNLDSASLTPTGAGNVVVFAVCSNPAGVALAMQSGCTADLSTNDGTNGETYGTGHSTSLTVSTTPITVGYTNGLTSGQFAAVEYLAGASSVDPGPTLDPVVIPNKYVGPMALRQRFRPPTPWYNTPVISNYVKDVAIGGSPVRIVTGDGTNNFAMSTGQTYYFPIAQSGLQTGFGNVYGSIVYQTAGTFSGLYINKVAGTLATTMTAEVNINNVTGNQVITMSNTNGIYEDTTHTDTCNAGDSVAYRVVASGAGTSLSISLMAATYQANSDTVNVLCANAGGGIPYSTANVTTFSSMVNGTGFNGTTQANFEWLVKLPPGVNHITIRNLGVRANFNTNTDPVQISVNGASGPGTAPTLTVNAGATGTFSDTVNSIQARDGDKLSFKLKFGPGTVSFAPNSIFCEIQSSNNVFHYITGEQAVAAANNPSFRVISGREAAVAAEANAQVRHGLRDTTLSLLSTYIATATASTLLKLRTGGTDAGGAGVMQVDTSQAANNWYTDTTHTYAAVPSDLLALTTTGSASGPSLYATVVTVQTIAPTAPPPIRIPNKFVGPMAQRFHFRQPFMQGGIPSGPQVYNANLTATLSFIGNSNKATTRALPGAILNFAGAFVKTTLKTPFIGVLSFVGAFSKRINKTLTGTLSFIGAINRFVTRSLTGTLSFIGAFNKQTVRALSATLSFIGAFTKKTNIPSTGTLSFTGTFAKLPQKSLTATLSFSGALVRFTSYLVNGTLSFIGNLNKLTSRSLPGATLSFVGTFTKTTIRPLTGNLSFIGALTRLTGKVFTGTLSFVGAFNKITNRALAGTLLFSGAFNASRLYARTVTGVLSFVGAFSKSTNRIQTGTLSFSGAFTKTTSRTLTGSLSFVGNLIKRTAKSLTGTLSFAGVFNKMSSRALTASLSFSGAFSKTTNKVQSGTLSFSGALVKSTSRTLTGTLSFIGNLAKTTKRSVSGVLSFIGNFVTQYNHGGTVFTQAFTAGLSFIGNFSKTTNNPLSGTLSFIGNITKSVRRSLSGTLSFVGTFAKQSSRALTGALSFVGSFNKTTQYPLSGALSFVGNLTRQVRRPLTGTLSFIGIVSKQSSRSLTGTLSFVGTFSKQSSRLLTGAVSFIGNFTKMTLYPLSGALSFIGNMSKRINRTLTGSLSFTGNVNKQVNRSLAGTLSFVGAFSKQINRIVSGSLSFAGTIQKVTGYVLPATLSFSGSLNRRTNRALNATLSFVGTFSFNRLYFRAFTGTVSFAGSFNKQINRTFTASLGFIGSVATFVIQGIGHLLRLNSPTHDSGSNMTRTTNDPNSTMTVGNTEITTDPAYTKTHSKPNGPTKAKKRLM